MDGTVKDYSAHDPGRKFTLLFYVDMEALRVVPVQGFECPPNNDWYWVPQYTVSACVGAGSLKRTERAAEIALDAAIKSEKERLKKRLKALDGARG